jgi:hypothetical protein
VEGDEAFQHDLGISAVLGIGQTGSSVETGASVQPEAVRANARQLIKQMTARYK